MARGMEPGKYQGSACYASHGEALVFRKGAIAAEIKDPGAIQTLMNLRLACGEADHKGCNTAKQLRIFKRYVPELISRYLLACDTLAATVESNKRIFNKIAARNNSRWSSEDDEILIELAVDEDTSLMEAACILGRTPAAIQTRLSHLVGINRISKKVYGRFVGSINGEYQTAYLDGQLEGE